MFREHIRLPSPELIKTLSGEPSVINFHALYGEFLELNLMETAQFLSMLSPTLRDYVVLADDEQPPPLSSVEQQLWEAICDVCEGRGGFCKKQDCVNVALREIPDKYRSLLNDYLGQIASGPTLSGVSKLGQFVALKLTVLLLDCAQYAVSAIDALSAGLNLCDFDPFEETTKIIPVGDLHEDGAISLRFESKEKVIFVKNRPYGTAFEFDEILKVLKVEHITIPKFEQKGNFLFELAFTDDRKNKQDLFEHRIEELAALSMALNLTDLSAENIVTNACGLCVVDYETAFRPTLFSNPAHLLQTSTYCGDMFFPRYFELHRSVTGRNRLEPTDRFCGIKQHLDDFSITALSNERIIEKTRLFLHRLREYPFNGENFYRVLIEDTAFYERCCLALFDGELAGSSYLGSIFAVAYYFGHHCRKESDPDLLYNLYYMLCATEGIIPTFLQRPKEKTVFAGSKQRIAILRSHHSGLEAMRYRANAFEANAPLNQFLLDQTIESLSVA